ncbi:MAG: TIGR00269 family protein [Candidatus Altiarchaeia archaeon]
MSDAEFIESFEKNVADTIKKYNLLAKENRVIVAVSGGKDSTTALYLLHKMGYDVEGMIIDQLLGEYSRKNLSNIQSFCKEKGIKLHVVHMRDEYGCSVCYIKSVLDEKGIFMNQCGICGVIRRSILNRKAREHSATKIATGHNLDDEAQTFFMNYIQGRLMDSARVGPLSGVVRNERFVPRIKPLYFCLEEETRRYSQLHEFPVVYDPCPCSLDSFRSEIKALLNGMEKEHPGTKRGIVESSLKIRPFLANEQKEWKIKRCQNCGEPSSGDTCRVCAILAQVSGGI